MVNINPIYFWPSTSPKENNIVCDFVHRGVWGVGNEIDKFATMGVFENNKLIAGTIYHNYHPREGVIELTSYSTSKKWLTRDVIRCMLNGPFVVLGCQMIVLRVSEFNKVMIGIARKFGFEETYIPRLRGRDEGEFVFHLTDDAWSSSKYNTGGF